MKLKVSEADVPSVQVRYQNAFIVEKPAGATDYEVRTALEKSLGFRLKDDVRELIDVYAPKLKVSPGIVSISPFKTRWGSCGKNGNIMINWLLISAPKPVLEYVVVHELCHLRYRNHSSDFWNLVAELIPEYQERKLWLDKSSKITLV